MGYETYNDACNEILDISNLLKARIKDAGKTMQDRDEEIVQFRAACWKLHELLLQRKNQSIRK